MSDVEQTTPSICASCGAKNSGGHRCSSCGASLVARNANVIEKPIESVIISSVGTDVERRVEIVRMVFGIIGCLVIFITLITYLSMILNVWISDMPGKLVFNTTITLNVAYFCGVGYMLRKMSRWFGDLVVSG